MSTTNTVVNPTFGDNLKRLLQWMWGQEVRTPIPAAPSSGPLLRRSNALREFCRAVQTPPGLQILDLGSASQANISFITGMGHKLYTEDLFRTLLAVESGRAGGAEPVVDEERFFRENLDYPEAHFDGILCWDLLDFLSDPLVGPLVERLHRLSKPGGNLLTFFRTSPLSEPVPLYQYRIRSEDTLQITGCGTSKMRRHFTNRTIENLFRPFASLRFYLARDNLREVIIVR